MITINLFTLLKDNNYTYGLKSNYLTKHMRYMHKLNRLGRLVDKKGEYRLKSDALSHYVAVKKDKVTGNNVLFAVATTKPFYKPTAVAHPKEKGLLTNTETKKQQYFQATPESWVLTDEQLKKNFNKLPDVPFTGNNNEEFVTKLYDDNPKIFGSQKQISDTQIMSIVTTKDVYAQSIVEIIKVEQKFKQQGKILPRRN